MEVILIRHFQTPGNIKKQYIGKTDEDLADVKALPKFRQKERADIIKKRRLVCQGITSMIVSPMKRCIQTAELLFPEMQAEICEHLRECDFGLFEGKSYEELKENKHYQDWLLSNGSIPFPGGEHAKTFHNRCRQGFQETVTKLMAQGCERAVFVVHGGTIMSILSGLDARGRDFYHWQPENGGGYRVRLEKEKWAQQGNTFTEIEKL